MTEREAEETGEFLIGCLIVAFLGLALALVFA